MMKKLTMQFLVVLLCWAGAMRPAAAITLPPGFSESTVAGGLNAPTAMGFAPDGRLFVCEQAGDLRVIENGVLLSTPLISLTVDSTGERGLLGVTFDPAFTSNGYLYLYYTATSPTVHNRVSRFTVSGSEAGSERVLLDLDDLSSASNHNGGAMHFGADGRLYIAVGDNARSTNAQTLENLLGKILRINSNGSIPTDNPFYNSATGRNRAIWAMGLRNPFTFAVQPGSGRIFINDVGSTRTDDRAREEINDGRKGANYGWPITEGVTTDPRFDSPVFAYSHLGERDSTGCAITGGAWYNPAQAQFPAAYFGLYFFADYCGGWIRKLDPASKTASNFAAGIAAPVDLQVGPDGALFYLARGDGAVHQIRYSANEPPTITVQPADQSVAAGLAATFSVSVVGSGLSYQWQRNGVDIAGATDASYTLPSVQTADNGTRFRVVVSNAFGSATSREATLTVTPGQPPRGSITTPAAGTIYSAGQTINYAGTATDAEDGALPPAAFSWRVDFHHDTHLHPFLPERSGQSGSFVIPTSGESDTNVWYRLHLTVRDSSGLTHTSYRDIHPRTATLRLATNPPGLQITLDGQPHPAPFSTLVVVGMRRTLGAPAPQTLNGVTYQFHSWSDGGAPTHDIRTRAGDTTYTATFRRAGDSTPIVTVAAPRENGLYRVLATAQGQAFAAYPARIARVTVRLYRYAGAGVAAGYWNGRTWDAAYNATLHERLASGTLNWRFSLPTAAQGFGTGRYLLHATATDDAGRMARSVGVRFGIDATPPVVTINNPAPGGLYSALTRATGTAADASGVRSVTAHLYRYGNGGSIAAGYWNGRTWSLPYSAAAHERPVSGAATWGFTLPTPAQGLVPGRYQIVASARDAAGNIGHSARVTFTISNAAPR